MCQPKFETLQIRIKDTSKPFDGTNIEIKIDGEIRSDLRYLSLQIEPFKATFSATEVPHPFSPADYRARLNTSWGGGVYPFGTE